MACNPKVDELRGSVVVHGDEQDVLGLDVPMDDVPVVAIAHGMRQLPDEPRDLRLTLVEQMEAYEGHEKGPKRPYIKEYKG